MRRFVCAAVLAAMVAAFPAFEALAGERDRVRYEKPYRDPVLKEMKAEMDSLAALRGAVTDSIDAYWSEIETEKRENRPVIRFDFSELKKPASPDVFDAPFHFPPVAQYYTSTCWCFSATSFLESEIHRLTGREVKLSEMHTVYWETVEKVRGWIEKRGHQPFAGGAESDGVLIIWETYGCMPHAAYPGLVGTDRHNHSEMNAEIRDYLDMIRDKGHWDEETAVAHVRTILDRHLGAPPESFEWEGESWTPARFFHEVTGIVPGDYVGVMSTLSAPFWRQARFDVPDNWRPTDTYWNLPLDEFMNVIKGAARKGYTMSIGGDVSEPGYYGFEDAAIVPSFDIPGDYIDQDSREFRIRSGVTGDDHGVHLLAWKRVGGRDWFLIKDSARSSRHGEFEGYYFYRDDYIKLKMLTIMVHKDAIAHLAAKLESGD
ncbi:MAG: peptidase C1 [Candidatus Krumholzibacteriota bacterium]|nr:peptidase C1 [Candidatus Krumholzibacteriota bacterium]